MQGRIHVWHRPPFWQINHANSAYFRLFLGYISHPPPLLDLGPPVISWIHPCYVLVVLMFGIQNPTFPHITLFSIDFDIFSQLYSHQNYCTLSEKKSYLNCNLFFVCLFFCCCCCCVFFFLSFFFFLTRKAMRYTVLLGFFCLFVVFFLFCFFF